jgi:hypothetical protein
MERKCIVRVSKAGKPYYSYDRVTKNRASREFYHAKQADRRCRSAFVRGLIENLTMPQARSMARHGLTEELLMEACEAALTRAEYPRDIVLAHFARVAERLEKSRTTTTADEPVPDSQEHEVEQEVPSDSA